MNTGNEYSTLGSINVHCKKKPIDNASNIYIEGSVN